MNAVTSWLLWSHRLASPLGGLTGAELSHVATSKGIPLTTFDIARAENGLGQADLRIIGRYEQLLELPPLSLSASLRAAARIEPTSPGSAALMRLRSIPETADARREVIANCFDREKLSAVEWLQLADALASASEMLLPPRIVSAWIHQLMDQCMRATDRGYYPRLEALSTLASDERYALDIIRAAEDLTKVPGVSGTREAWSVVGDVRSAAAINTLIADLEAASDERFDNYSIALVSSAHLRTLSADQLQAIADEITRRLSRWSLSSYEPLAQLAAELPHELAGPILKKIDAVHPLARLTGQRTGRDVSDEVELYTRAAMADTWPNHPGGVLNELLRIALQGNDSGTRFHAVTLIRQSPFVATICDTAADVCVSDADATSRQLASYLVMNLATRASENRLRRVLEESPAYRVSALVGLAHSGALNADDDLERWMKDPKLRMAAIYAAGITGHPAINSAYATGAEAAWWRAKGGGVTT
ncbi:hypothetical protein IEE94_13530 [Yimella sp. cx-573]|nr:hypothetical protein [Yimella sp. cx-573]